MEEIKILKHSDIKELREKLHAEQGEICCICGQKISYDEMTLDHSHKSTGGSGLVRGAICRTCNSWIGKIENSFIRYGHHKKNVSISYMLRNVAEYIEKEHLPFLHPTEVPKRSVLKKRDFNKLQKLYVGKYPKRKPLEYPKSGKLTKKIKVLFEEFDITP